MLRAHSRGSNTCDFIRVSHAAAHWELRLSSLLFWPVSPTRTFAARGAHYGIAWRRSADGLGALSKSLSRDAGVTCPHTSWRDVCCALSPSRSGSRPQPCCRLLAQQTVPIRQG